MLGSEKYSVCVWFRLYKIVVLLRDVWKFVDVVFVNYCGFLGLLLQCCGCLILLKIYI